MEENQTVLEQELIEQGFKKEDLERLRKFRLMDDDFMSKCFEDNIECTELVVQIVLNRDDLKIEQVHAQHQIKSLQGRSIILDIYAMDKKGKRYNIEIQRADRGAVPKRARYHSSVIDSNTINAKQNPRADLPIHVDISDNLMLHKNSVVLLEQIRNSYRTHLSDDMMQNIDKALIKSLGINTG